MSESLQTEPMSARSASRGGNGGKSPSAFRTISEVAGELDVPQHVLRFWESKFSQVRPLKRGGGRRYYRPEDIELLRSIRQLLYQDGYTIKGVQKLLREGQVLRSPSDAPAEVQPVRDVHAGRMNAALRREIESVIDELTELKRLLQG